MYSFFPRKAHLSLYVFFTKFSRKYDYFFDFFVFVLIQIGILNKGNYSKKLHLPYLHSSSYPQLYCQSLKNANWHKLTNFYKKVAFHKKILFIISFFPVRDHHSGLLNLVGEVLISNPHDWFGRDYNSECSCWH